MSTSLRKARANLEKGVAQYIMGKLVGTAYAAIPVNVRMGEIDGTTGAFTLAKLDELPLPMIAVACPRAERHSMGFPVCQLHVIVLGSIDGNTDADTPSQNHEDLAGFIGAMIGEENYPAIILALNPPLVGPDNRVMKDLLVFGIIYGDELSQETDRSYLDDWTLTVHCQPTTDTSL